MYTPYPGGPAISIVTDNVTIDCNHHRISGLAGGPATEATGINTGPSRSNATVRNCQIQGFKHGVVLHGKGHLVEHNRFERNTATGIHATGEGVVIRRNIVASTGGYAGAGTVKGIDAGEGVVVENAIYGVDPSGSTIKSPIGIHIRAGLVQSNRISALAATDTGTAIGVRMDGAVVARGNVLMQGQTTSGYAIRGTSGAASVCRENDVQGYSQNPAITQCFGYGNIEQ